MKSVLISIQPYYVFLIIAKIMGWDVKEEKTVEVRKTFPKDENWDKVVKMYCSNNKKSFSMIPKEYQPLMKQFLGKVVGEFVCDCIEADDLYNTQFYQGFYDESTCLNQQDLIIYGRGERLYFWHISNLVVYDKPKELSEFRKPIVCTGISIWHESCTGCWKCKIEKPPQSWCYVESEA